MRRIRSADVRDFHAGRRLKLKRNFDAVYEAIHQPEPR